MALGNRIDTLVSGKELYGNLIGNDKIKDNY